MVVTERRSPWPWRSGSEGVEFIVRAAENLDEQTRVGSTLDLDNAKYKTTYEIANK